MKKSQTQDNFVWASGYCVGASITAVLLSIFWLALALWWKPLTFDDAYMFYRYAMNMRHGLGISWNPDGIPTYGLTSQLWVWFILPFTFLPISAGNTLRLASWLAGNAALFMMCFTVVRNAGSSPLRFAPLAFAAVALPLLINPMFAYHMNTGMDTMLSMLANAALVFALLDYRASPQQRRALFVGFLAFTAVLARPDNVICGLATSLLIWATLPRTRRWCDLLGLLAFPVLLIAASLLVCRWYFGVALPLSFYAKAMHTYAGFQSPENALKYLFLGSLCALPFLGMVCATYTRQSMALLAAFLLPVAATFLYLLAVRQIMGHYGRYYMPFLPFLIVPALLCAASGLERDARGATIRISAAILTAPIAFISASPLWNRASDAYFRLILPAPIPVPSLVTTAHEPLPQVPWFEAIRYLGDDVLARLPPGASMAASEVGYLGYIAPRMPIIDLVGLNDTRIGMRGFSMNDLLERAPDLIWFPHLDYTGLRSAMLTDPRLFDRYIVLDEAFNYGLAIRGIALFSRKSKRALALRGLDSIPGRSSRTI